MENQIDSVIEDNDVEIVSVTLGSPGNNPSPNGNNEDGGQGSKKLAHVGKSKPPQCINGYMKPLYNYCRLITQAIASTPERKATATEICDLIASKYPYYKFLTTHNWRGSICCSLRTRKKFFTVVDTNEKYEFIWSLNPTFEKFMLEKWVAKFHPKQDSPSEAPGVVQKLFQKKSLTSSIKNYIPWLDKSHPQQFKPSDTNKCSVLTPASTSPTVCTSEPPSPVIVLAGTIVGKTSLQTTVVDSDNSSSDSATSEGEKDPLAPGNSPSDPGPVIQSVTSIEDNFTPWEPEVRVNELISIDETQQPINTSTFTSQEPSMLEKMLSNRIPFNKDFSLDNLGDKYSIVDEEIVYRANFSKEHTGIGKFRLHCTVCDDHLGSSGTVCRRKARLHFYLGVLVCSKCYDLTCKPNSWGCLWCAKSENLNICCIKCTSKFCQNCVVQNFGQTWCAAVKDRSDWECFQCDTKQIWPHRAIAYFLLRHYRDIKRRKDELARIKNLTPREVRFFITDYSTCCKNTVAVFKGQPNTPVTQPTSDRSPVVSPNVSPPVVTNPAMITQSASSTSVSSQTPFIVIGDQRPKYVYVQTPNTVPLLTLNTGTQYIHNVYHPDKNYVVLDDAIKNRQVPPATPASSANTILSPHSPSSASNIPFTIPKHLTVKALPCSQERVLPPYPLPTSPPPPYSAINTQVAHMQESSNEAIQESNLNVTREAQCDVTTSKAVDINKPNACDNSTIKSGRLQLNEPIIIPDDDSPNESKIHEEEVVDKPILSARERIERRPMPKSKKQSLLKTVLMNESIESMKRHLQLNSQPNISKPTCNNDSSTLSSSPEISQEDGRNIEEPILKSIIETATERLLNLQRNQSISLNKCNNVVEPVSSVPSTSDTYIDLSEDENPPVKEKSQIIEPPIKVPKIKIKTLKELQDPELFHGSNNDGENQAQTNEESANKECDSMNEKDRVENEEPNRNSLSDEAKINITDLKLGIVEVSRSLINTQKQFQELAKVISSNLTYKPDQAIELITIFHDILKVCHQELDLIDGSVKNKFKHVIPKTDINSILQSINKNKDVADSNAGPRKKKKKKINSDGKIIQKNINHNEVINDVGIKENQIESFTFNTQTDETENQSNMKRKRDLVDFNPLGKKVILGSPDVTEEDLRRIPQSWDTLSQEEIQKEPPRNEVYLEELRRRQYLAKKIMWKKKNIWLTSKRKKRQYTKSTLQHPNSPLRFKEDGSVVKKRGRPPKKRRKISDSDDDNDETYKPYASILYSLLNKRRSMELSCPLRLSARRHPSTVAHVAQLMSYEQRGVTHVIKPCSVVLERLDPRILKILERHQGI